MRRRTKPIHYKYWNKETEKYESLDLAEICRRENLCYATLSARRGREPGHNWEYYKKSQKTVKTVIIDNEEFTFTQLSKIAKRARSTVVHRYDLYVDGIITKDQLFGLEPMDNHFLNLNEGNAEFQALSDKDRAYRLKKISSSGLWEKKNIKNFVPRKPITTRQAISTGDSETSYYYDGQFRLEGQR